MVYQVWSNASLWMGEERAVVVDRKTAQKLLSENANKVGVPTIVVNGKIRELYAKPAGAGLYRVATKPYDFQKYDKD